MYFLLDYLKPTDFSILLLFSIEVSIYSLKTEFELWIGLKTWKMTLVSLHGLPRSWRGTRMGAPQNPHHGTWPWRGDWDAPRTAPIPSQSLLRRWSLLPRKSQVHLPLPPSLYSFILPFLCFSLPSLSAACVVEELERWRGMWASCFKTQSMNPSNVTSTFDVITLGNRLNSYGLPVKTEALF